MSHSCLRNDSRAYPQKMTERFLREAGIINGLRVLDVGCGPGEVSRLLSKIVGEKGNVLGIDRSAGAITAAVEVTRKEGLNNIRFVEGNMNELSPEAGLFDAIVGRRVLMYQGDPSRSLKCLAQLLKPGGIVFFEEVDATIAPLAPVPHPLHERVRGWIWLFSSNSKSGNSYFDADRGIAILMR